MFSHCSLVILVILLSIPQEWSSHLWTNCRIFTFTKRTGQTRTHIHTYARARHTRHLHDLTKARFPIKTRYQAGSWVLLCRFGPINIVIWYAWSWPIVLFLRIRSLMSQLWYEMVYFESVWPVIIVNLTGLWSFKLKVKRCWMHSWKNLKL